jgi:lysophospholipase L1-like esterase
MIALSLAATLAAAPLLKDGDRVVWFGDSITAQHTYTRLVEEYVKLRYSEQSITFINAGIGGHTAWDGLQRFDTDVAAEKPSVVLVNFGMNDAVFPPDTNGAAFEKNMGDIFDRLEKIGVRVAVWIDTSPLDADGLATNHKNAKREERIKELVEHARVEGKRRGLVVVPWHQAITDAMAAWKAAGHLDKLMADRIHPGPQAYAVMAAAVLRGLGYDVTAPTSVVPWDGARELSIDLVGAPAPLPMGLSRKEADDLAAKDVANLKQLMLRVEKLPVDRSYGVAVGDLELGVFSAKDLARGVDLMGSAEPRLPLPLTVRPDLSTCTASTGNPWLNDFYCLFDLLYEKDQLRILMRNEKVRHLPDFIPGRLEQYLAFQQVWVAAVDVEIGMRARALRVRPHRVTLVPLP